VQGLTDDTILWFGDGGSICWLNMCWKHETRVREHYVPQMNAGGDESSELCMFEEALQ